MKKLLSILSLTLCFVLILSGCSQNEIGLINLYQEFTNQQKFELAGDITFNSIDENFQAHFIGKVDLDKNSPYADITTSFTIPNKQFQVNAGRIILNNNNIFISKNLLEAFIVYENPDLKEIFKKLSQHAEYYSVEPTDISEAGIQMQMMTITDKQKEDFLNAFKNLDTGLVKGTENNYEIYMTEKDLVPLLEKILTFAQNNKEDIYNYIILLVNEYYEEYVANLTKQIEDLDAEIPTKQEVIQEIENFKEDFFTGIDELAKEFTPEIKDSINKSLNEVAGSYLKENFYKKDDIYYSSADIQLKIQTYESLGENLDGMTLVDNTIVIKSEVAAKPVAVIERENITNAIKLDEKFDEELDRQYLREFPSEKVEITWYDNEDNTAYMEIYNVKGEMTYAIKEMFMKDDRVYLPMRYIAELFGEQVEWDAKKSEANVILDGAKINMSGIIKDGKTYVKIRDFEKLGYKVNYEFNGIEHIATITKGN